MKELENVGLKWDLILKPHIEQIQKQNPDMNIKSLFTPLISMLNSNRIPSRVILSAGKVMAYAYVLPAMGIRDRNIASIGFIEEDDSNRSRGESLLKWLEGESSRERKLLILDGLYNSSFLDVSLREIGFHRSTRIKMIGHIDNVLEKLSHYNFEEIEMSTEILHSSDVNPEALSEIQYGAYSESPDRVLLILENEKNITFEILLSGYYGKILTSSSIILVNRSGIVGSITVSDGSEEIIGKNIPLIVDFFTSKIERSKGYGIYILKKSLESLKLLGYKEVQLWVNQESSAYQYYLKRGFNKTGEENTTYWKDYRSIKN
ncbi:GNAT family N-acetyltransferase [Cuniculiplasma sp. SKW4]|uniref:GNAT family N-acetyltransferase n=1 Tax=Cuniculiplasma sp. SKW4 TaxID=3400171 RepID=UPI003FCFECE5